MIYDKDALRRLMVARGFDIPALARAAGVMPRTVNYIVRGMTMPRADTLGKLAHALHVSVARFYQKAA
jgi:transcriptional regulator with XRE-family HTH domain